MQGRLFRKYALVLTGLLSIALLVSGLIGVYFSYHDTRALVEELQSEKALAAATRIEHFVKTAEIQLRSALPMAPADLTLSDESQYLELLKLLRLAPVIANAAWINDAGRERVRVSRIARDVVGSNRDRTHEPAFHGADGTVAWYGPIFFSRGSEPYVSAAVGDKQRQAGVVIADINLKFVQDVVTAIRAGAAGHAYVVDAQGRLISHPDMSLVLKLTDWSAKPQVAAALASVGAGMASAQTLIEKNQIGLWTLTGHASIDTLGWHIFVEQPLSEAFAPLLGSLLRAGLVLLVGVAFAVVVSRRLARQMVAPIRTLEAGVARLAAGQLDQPVVVQTGDELEDLSHEFNRMASELKESYAGLEQKIEARTLQLLQANSAKSRFLASASHDLRQPVHALGLFVAQLEDTHEPLARQRIVEKIATSSLAVSELLEALLDISRLDADTLARIFHRNK